MIVLTIPLTKQTKNLIGQKELQYLKRDAILINAARGDIINQEDPILAPLRQALLSPASPFIPVEPGEKFTGEVTIMGDRAIPYKLLKKIMVTCAKSNYTKLSLAVNQASSEKNQAQ